MYTVGDLKKWLETSGVKDDVQIMSVCTREDQIYEGSEPVILDLMWSHTRYGLNHYEEVEKESIGSIKGVLM